MLIQAKSISKNFGERCIFSGVDIVIRRGDRIGIVGTNGSGKSTLMSILSDKTLPDSGSVFSRCRISYVDQLGTDAGEGDAYNRAAFSVGDAHSGGEIMRKKLAEAFSSQFDILMLDEPTSNLDAEAVDILCAALEKVETLVIISHDSSILDRFCTRIIEVKNGAVTEYTGNYADYETTSSHNISRQKAVYDQYIKEKERLTAAIDQKNKKASSVNKAPSRMGNSEARLHKLNIRQTSGKLSREGAAFSSRLRQLTEPDRPDEEKDIRINFSLTDPPKNKIVLSANDLTFGYDGKLIFENAQFDIPNGAHVAVTGGNGAGKTTLLSLIYDSPNIYRVPKARLGFIRQDLFGIELNKSVLENVMFGTVQPQYTCRQLLANLGLPGDDVHKPAHVLSGGELIKVALAKLIVSGCNIIILDEPTNYLDIHSVKQVRTALNRYEGTLIFVSHDRGFIDGVADVEYVIRDKKLVKR